MFFNSVDGVEENESQSQIPINLKLLQAKTAGHAYWYNNDFGGILEGVWFIYNPKKIWLCNFRRQNKVE